MPCASPLSITRYAVWIFLFPSFTFSLWEGSRCVLENFSGILTSRNLVYLTHGFCNFIRFLKSGDFTSPGWGIGLILTVLLVPVLFLGLKIRNIFYQDVYIKIYPWKKSSAYNKHWMKFLWRNDLIEIILGWLKSIHTDRWDLWSCTKTKSTSEKWVNCVGGN